MNEELRTVAMGFHYKVLRYDTYDVNGYRFRTRNHEEGRPNRSTTNSGVFTVCNGVEFYGILEEIYELQWKRVGGPQPKVVIFKCKWFDPEHYRGEPTVGLVEINREKLLVCDDVYIVAQEATQVYFLPYACKIARLKDYDVVYKVSPYGKLPMPIDADYNPLINADTYDGEFFQEEGGLTGHFVIDLTGGEGMEVDIGGDNDVEEEVDDIEDLAFLERLSAQKDNATEDGDVGVDDTRDSDDEIDPPLADARPPDPDDPDLVYLMYAFYLFYFTYFLFILLHMLSIYFTLFICLACFLFVLFASHAFYLFYLLWY